MKKTIKYFSVYDIVFIIAAAAIFIYAVLITPAHSIADQGDFERIMRPCGLDFEDGYSFYGYAWRFFIMRFTSVDLLLYIPRLLFILPSTSFIIPVSAAKLLSLPICVFDMRILSVIMFLWYTLVCMLILRQVKIKKTFVRLAFIVLFLIIFYNGINLTLFNSLYGQSVMLTSFATLILASIYLFRNISTVKVSKAVFFTVASCLVLGSKLQCVVFTPFLAAAIIYAGFKSKRLMLCILCALFILYHGAVGYVINGTGLSKATQYNSVFYGILKDSKTPEEDLLSLGIDSDMAADSGKHAFLDVAEYKYPPQSAATAEKFYAKISNTRLIKFYITHPKKLISAMEETAQNAFYNRIDLGTFEEKYGFEEGFSSYRFTLWEDIRSHFPRTLSFIIPAWLLLFYIAIIMISRKNTYGIPIISIFIIGALQFPMPYIGNGAADISKQLFMFNIIFDFGIILLIYFVCLWLDKFFQKSP